MFHRLLLGGLLTLGLAPAATGQILLPTEAPSTKSLDKLQLKLGTGLTRHFNMGGTAGLTVPVVLGAEHLLGTSWSAYLNGEAGFYFGGNKLRDADGNHRPLGLNSTGFDAGIRRYYNQEKRHQQGRATGVFVGNYLALHSSSKWENNAFNSTRLRYQSTTLTVLWGLQRRLGGHGLLDAYVGPGFANERRERHTPNGFVPRRHPFTFVPQAGVKLSLVL
ncbi:hypothetical protein [Hymenobacter volaticus]|uniref:DUF3575 domain-containing protein n=1 Tax=Hymenobacter volaticus TaxID=2932254 RepID=A0ABY4GFK9_9BACT|nr:hypothetical protein [Hymenobacter volaticus]UOQ69747.1 hypothetical protein MUN86_30000 [Hymenobacter volaticus]